MKQKSASLDTAVAALRDIGKQKVPSNHVHFTSLLRKSRDLVEKGDLDTASVYASIAAAHAGSHHCGVWASPELEAVLRSIGLRLPPAARRLAVPKELTGVEKVCHIMTAAYPVAGHTRMLTRWIEADHSHKHSVVLTSQLTQEIPAFLRNAVCSSGGCMHLLDAEIGGLIERARALRQIAAQADLVVLHLHGDDVVPIIALATEDRPPVIFLDLADHAFWLGATVSDVVASMRDAGRQLVIERRGVAPARVTLLPTLLEPVQRTISRESAKRQLGLPDDCVLLTSVARAAKYRPIGEQTYADLHVPILLKHPQCILLVVGPGGQQDWTEAQRRTGGRVIALPEQRDPAPYFQAADIYVDSFPFVSITSLLEAASYGTPAVSLFPYGDPCSVLASNMPGLDQHLITCRRAEEYHAQLSHLIVDKNRRDKVGAALCNNVILEHTGVRWLQALKITYELALSVPRNVGPKGAPDRATFDELDMYIQAIFGVDTNPETRTDRMLRFRLGQLPANVRIGQWWRLLKARRLQRTSRFGPAVYLLPEWLLCRLGRFRRRLLRAIHWKLRHAPTVPGHSSQVSQVRFNLRRYGPSGRRNKLGPVRGQPASSHRTSK